MVTARYLTAVTIGAVETSFDKIKGIKIELYKKGVFTLVLIPVHF